MTIPPNPHPEQVEALDNTSPADWVNSIKGVKPTDQFIALDRRAFENCIARVLASLANRPADDGEREAIRAEIINTPETADFMAGVPIEAAHQRERWGSSHDAGKTPEDWFWLIGYLAQKALRAQNAGDTTKALHHTISTAAALSNWHAAIAGVDTSMRPGIMPPQPEGVKRP